jgi:energy-coupling factor transporter ATP-binding protein EcfA2/histidinol phosphatase-like PHP family hydrolase
MSSTSYLPQILNQAIGAVFYRADLHIHSFGASHDVKDAAMTPAAIVSTAVQEKLALIAVTDHNEITNVEAAIVAAGGTSVCVIPGVELSTVQGHLLCYLPSVEALKSFYGQLNIVDHGLPNSRCQQSMLECLNLVAQQGGFAVLAHVEAPAGYEHDNPGASPHKYDVLCHRALLGIELKKATSDVSFSEADSDTSRQQIGRERIKRLQLGSKQFLARVLNSDAHALEALGRNAANARKVTRYKMEAPSFHALRIALEDADARVRLEDEVPPRTPRVVGLYLDGGFLNGQMIRFSPNLNCIIGGRGTGKSTMFEAVRCAAEGEIQGDVVDSEVWPDSLQMFIDDKAGQRHSISRIKDGEMVNDDDPQIGPTLFEIDCFGQGEAARISVEAQKNPLALLEYLDKFVDLEVALGEESDAREKLLTLQTEIEKTEEKVNQIPQYERLLNTTKQQLAALQKPEVKSLIELSRQLSTEREIRRQVTAKLQQAKADVGKATLVSCISEIQGLAGTNSLSVGASEFKAIADGANQLTASVGVAEGKIREELKSYESVVNAQLLSWKGKDAEAQKRVDEKRHELEALKVSFDMSYITKLTRDEATYAQSVQNLNTWKPRLVEVKKQRSIALKERWAAREKVAMLRDGFARLATRILRESLSDLQVSLRYTKSAYSQEAADYIILLMGWKTNQQVRANWLVETLTIPLLLSAIERNDPKPLQDIKTSEGVSIFQRDEALQILQRLSEPAARFRLERVAIHDLPRLQVSRSHTDASGATKHVIRDFAKLSLGQKQSVLLALMLSSNSEKPLIIDQPEDNLDGEFIYKTLVPVLRRAKERRQVIIVTHNANVAVLGDAELIVVMKAMNDRGEVVNRGSIDQPETRRIACAILEGSPEAFLRRAKMYGMPVQVS